MVIAPPARSLVIIETVKTTLYTAALAQEHVVAGVAQPGRVAVDLAVAVVVDAVAAGLDARVPRDSVAERGEPRLIAGGQRRDAHASVQQP